MSVALTTLASCSNEEVIEVNNNNAIMFRASMSQGVNTRGQEMNTDRLNQFYVTAIDNGKQFFINRLFKKHDTVFELDGTDQLQWPENETLKFYAYTYYNKGNDLPTVENLANVLGTVSIEGTSQKIKNFTTADNIKDQIDLVTATASGSKADAGSGVSLQFKHALIQAEFMAKSDNNVYGFKISGVKLANVVSKGNFDFNLQTQSEWDLITDNTNKKTYSISYDSPITLGSDPQDIGDKENNGLAMLIPQQLIPWSKTNKDGAYVAVNLQIYIKKTGIQVFPIEKADSYGWALIPVSTKWVSGNHYIYTLDFTKGAGYGDDGEPILGGPIYFTATVSPWTEIKENVDMKKEINNKAVNEIE